MNSGRMFRDVLFLRRNKPTIFINLVAIAFFRNLIERQATGIRTEERASYQLMKTKPIMMMAAIWKPTVSMRIGTRNPQMAAEKRVTKNVKPCAVAR